RSLRDWSSDVCSSDLSNDFDGDERIGTITIAKARFGREMHIDARYHGARGTWRDLGEVTGTPEDAKPTINTVKPSASSRVVDERSEERRVGKEWRGGG